MGEADFPLLDGECQCLSMFASLSVALFEEKLLHEKNERHHFNTCCASVHGITLLPYGIGVRGWKVRSMSSVIPLQTLLTFSLVCCHSAIMIFFQRDIFLCSFA